MNDCEHWVYDYICSVYECTQCKGEECKDYKKRRNPFTEMTEEQLKRTLEYQAWKTNRRAEQ